MVMSVTQNAPRAFVSAGILVNGSPVPTGFKLGPGRPITLTAQVGGLISGGHMRFEIKNQVGTVVFGPEERSFPVFQRDIQVNTVAPTPLGLYTVVFTEIITFLPDNTYTFPFEVSNDPDIDPGDGGGGVGDFLGDIKNLLLVGGVVAALIAVAPTLNTVSRTVGSYARK